MVKVLKEGIPPWMGKWECGDCGRRIETTSEDEGIICYRLPPGEECTLLYGFIPESMFFGERLVGACPTCKKDTVHWPV